MMINARARNATSKRKHSLCPLCVQAVGDVCEYIGKCTQPVCNEDTMYNNTKVDVVAMHTLRTAQLKRAA